LNYGNGNLRDHSVRAQSFFFLAFFIAFIKILIGTVNISQRITIGTIKIHKIMFLAFLSMTVLIVFAAKEPS
jgi:hypothetical protein